MATNALINGIKAIRYVSLRGLTTGTLRVLPAPGREVVLNRNITSEDQVQTGDDGTTVLANQLITGEAPTITLPYGFKTIELMALQQARTVALSNSQTVYQSKAFQATTGTIAGAASGKEGFGMTANQTASRMSALINGISTPLTRQTYGTFNAATPLSFAQGADGAIRLSDDIVSAGYFVTFNFPNTGVTNVATIQDAAEENFAVTLVGILDDLTIFNDYYSNCFLSLPDMQELNYGTAGLSIVLRPSIAQDGCGYRRTTFSPQKFACVAA